MTYYCTLVNGLRRWRQAIATSLGAADADKLIKLDAGGLIDNSLMPANAILRGSPGAQLRSNAGTVEARNAANSALAPFRSSSLEAVGAGGGSLSFTPNFGGGANSVMELRANSGLVFQDWTANTSDDYNARLILNSSTQFRFQGAGALQYYFDAPLNTTSITASGEVDAKSLVQMPIGSPEGLILIRTSATVISFSGGRAVVVNAADKRYIAVGTAGSKSLSSAWATGSGNGGRFSGTVSANQWWHAFIMRNDTTGAIDFGFDTSESAANKPSGWSCRMIGSFRTDGSSNILDFYQIGDTFYWKVERLDFSSAVTTTAANVTVSVPSIASVEAILRVASGLPVAGTTASVLVSSVATTDTAPSIYGLSSVEARYVLMDTAAHQAAIERVAAVTSLVRIRATFTGTASWQVNPKIYTLGYVHPRGAY